MTSIYQITQRVLRLPPGVTIFHLNMSQGREVMNSDWTDWTRPLRLWKNMYDVPEIMLCGIKFMLTETLSRHFRDLEHVRLREVAFEHRFKYAFCKGDMGFEKDFPEWTSWEWYDWYKQPQFVHDPNLNPPDEPYFQLDVPLLELIADSFHGPRLFGEFHPGQIRLGVEPVKLALPETWYQRSGLAQQDGLLMAGWLFDTIDPFLDRDYFAVKRIELRR